MNMTSSIQDGWMEGSVKLKLPAEDRTRRAYGEASAPECEVEGIHYRSLLAVLQGALKDPKTPPLHYTPHRQMWNPFPEDIPERVYGESYTADAWLRAHDDVQKLPKIDGIANFILHIILYSDSTHLANFGPASLWPLYIYLGNVSKYMRCKPSEAVCYHLAYIPSVRLSSQRNRVS